MLLQIKNRAEAVKHAVEIFAAVKADDSWIGRTAAQANQVWVRLGANCFLVSKYKLYREINSPSTKKPYLTFGEWIADACGKSRRQINALICVVRDLPLKAEQMEQLGQEKCKHLARLGRVAPKKLPAVIEHVLKNPDMTVQEVRTVTAQALEGQHMDGTRWEHFDFSVPLADAKIVREAFEVIQEEDPLDDPTTPVSRGRHITHMLAEWLDLKEHRATRKKLLAEGKLGAIEVEVEE